MKRVYFPRQKPGIQEFGGFSQMLYNCKTHKIRIPWQLPLAGLFSLLFVV